MLGGRLVPRLSNFLRARRIQLGRSRRQRHHLLGSLVEWPGFSANSKGRYHMRCGFILAQSDWDRGLIDVGKQFRRCSWWIWRPVGGKSSHRLFSDTRDYVRDKCRNKNIRLYSSTYLRLDYASIRWRQH